jgi:hypothetical protein
MNLWGLIFTLIASVYVFILPRHLAAIPLLVGAAYITRDQQLEIGPAHFPVVRILVTVGALRIISKDERIAGGLNWMDRFIIIWSLWLVSSSVFHVSGAWVLRSGMVWTEIGCYFLFRVFIQNREDVQRIFKFLCVVLIPLAVLMLLERFTGKNFFSVLLGGREIADFRHGHFRARGSFAHAILAGTVGATCLPMALYLWRKYPKYALAGLFSTGGIIFACTSSGPIMMVMFILLGIAFWTFRKYLNVIRWGALTAVIALNTIMKDPVYFLMARIDISGGSTGHHRARLIQTSIEHLDEWGVAGTDNTCHWMSTCIPGTTHADITNHFLAMGVLGGLPLMFIFIMILVIAFRAVGKAMHEKAEALTEHKFLIWTLGAILFGHMFNFFAISLFDQSIVFFYLILASIVAVQNANSFAATEVKKLVNRIVQSRYAAIQLNKSKKGIAPSLGRCNRSL